VTEHAYALILAGGGGTRLWPASRRKRPKQFLPLLPHGRSLLAGTVERLRPVVPDERMWVVTAASQVDEVRTHAPGLGIVVEPEARNTAPCIGLGALAVLARDPEGVVAVVPSDQFVSRPEAYQQALHTALAAASGPSGRVVTIGLTPTHPETGYGYIEVGAPLDGAGQQGARQIVRFVEKPDRATAEGYLASGRFVWNSGMFFFRAARLLELIRLHMPELGALLDAIARDPARTAELYPNAPAISIDYGVMEKLGSDDLAVVPADFGWNDVGSWAALGTVTPADARGNVAVGEVITVDSDGNLIYAGEGQLVAAVGVENLVVVAAGGAVLVLPKERAQDVREIVQALKDRKRETWL